MTFSFLGGGGGFGSGINVLRYVKGRLAGVNPDPNRFLQLWDPNDPMWPEPDIAHVLYYGGTGWMNKYNASDREDYPPACGCAFGYKKFRKENVPQRLYGWIGALASTFPYDYSDSSAYGGFNIGPSRTGAWELPTPTRQGFFHKTDYLAPNVYGHAKGQWDAVFPGGNGHWFKRTLVVTSPDGCGSNASVFGRGYPGDVFPGGTGGPGTATARGPVATHIADGVLDELGAFKRFVKGKAQVSPVQGDNGDFVVDIPSDMFEFAGAPVSPDGSLLKLPWGPTPTSRDFINSYGGGFGAILQYL